jgi:VWFA-related protein
MLLSRRLFVLLTLSAVLFALPSTAQQPIQPPAGNSPAAEPPKFVSRTNLVLVPVMVIDKSGKHVSGLGKDAFRLEEDGKAQALAEFEEVKTEKASGNAQTPAAIPGYSNFPLKDDRQLRMTIIVLDMINTPYLKQSEAKKELIKYLSRHLTQDEPVTLLALRAKGLVQLHSFTTDTPVLIAALKKVQGQVSSSELNDRSAGTTRDTTEDLVSASGDNSLGAATSSMQNSMSAELQQFIDFMKDSEATMAAYQRRDAIRQTLAGMEQIAHAYAAIPGRKTLVWATGGFAFLIDDPAAFGRMGTDMVAQYERTWRALDSANVAVYPIDVNGLINPAMEAGGALAASSRSPVGRMPGGVMGPNPTVGIMNSPMAYDKTQQQHTTLLAFAKATGGSACLDSNSLEKCYAKAVDDSSAYYLLGYYLSPDQLNPGWRKLRVKVANANVHVRSREGFYVGAAVPDTLENRKRQLLEALSSPLESTGMRINARQLSAIPENKPGEAARTKVEFMVAIRGKSMTIDRQNENAINVGVLSVALDKDGKIIATESRTVTEKLQPHEKLLLVLEGIFGIRQQLPLPAGTYTVRFAVLDNLSGQLGTVSVPVEVK